MCGVGGQTPGDGPSVHRDDCGQTGLVCLSKDYVTHLRVNLWTEGGFATRPYRLPAAVNVGSRPDFLLDVGWVRSSGTFPGCRNHLRADSGYPVTGLGNAGEYTSRTLDYLQAGGALVRHCDQRLYKLRVASRWGEALRKWVIADLDSVEGNPWI